MDKLHVSRKKLRQIFLDHGVWNELRQGVYSYDPRDKATWPIKQGHSPSGGMQVVHKWKDVLGRHVVTTHAVLDSEGWPVHWDEKDIIIGGTKYIHRKELDTAED